MGHYLGEMESDEETSARMREANKAQDLRHRGYKGVSYDIMARDIPKLHKPCGLIVGDPDVHDGLCPVKEAT